jgi:ribosomal protein L17
MAEKEVKPKSFRLDDDTAERFRDIAAEIGGNQQETLSKLIEAYEFQRGKAVLIERKADIERFEGYVNLLSRMFMGVLEDNQNVSETVRGEFVAQLNAKDMTIRDLQDKVNSILLNHETVTSELEKLKEAHAVIDELLRKSRSDLKEKETQFNSMLADKDVLNKALSGSIEEQKEKIARMSEELSSAQETKVKFKEMAFSLEETEKSNVAAMQEIELLKKQLAEAEVEAQKNTARAVQAKELEFEKKLLEVEKANQSEIQRIEQEKRTEINEYQSKYLALLERIKEQGFAESDNKGKGSKK